MKIQNSRGKVFYGLHFYPGVAEYREDGKTQRVFLNENTIRSMDPSFAGCPVFVRHVDDVSENLQELKAEADGWVVESFFNQADGMHWAKMVIVSDKAETCIKNGWKLSNCYIAQGPRGPAGLSNGVHYDQEIKNGKYEHMAIVDDARYERSMILDPEQFKEYNESRFEELKRLSNNKTPTESKVMKMNFFKRTKIENSLDLGETLVVLPKSKKELSVEQAMTDLDEMIVKNSAGIQVNGAMMPVEELVKKYNEVCNELEAMKKANADKEAGEKEEMPKDDEDGSKKENMEDEAAKEKALQLAEHEEKEIVEAKKKNAKDEEDEKKRIAKERAERLRNAHSTAKDSVVRVEIMSDRVARGRARYGS